jgi:hypothetical protein
MAKTTAFGRWFDTLISEKGIDLEEVLTVEGPSGANWIPVGVLAGIIKTAPAHEQAGIKSMLVRIDFANGNVRHYLTHLAKAVAQ